MKKIFSIIFLLVSISVSAQQIEKIINTPPNPPKLVNDFTGLMTPDQVQTLERKLVNYDRSTSTQIAIVVVNTLEGMSDEDAALSILRKWGVGGKQDNGVVILAAIKDKKLRIETGYGMEGAVPDATAKAIIDNSIAPNFRAGNYYRGFDQAVDDIMRAAEGRYKAPAGYGKNSKVGKGIGGLVFILVILFIIIISSRGGGRGGGGMVSRRGYRDFGAGWILGSLLGGGGGGGFGGGGGWSGGGGGGGFGGFGGGSGGGGGASGSW